LLGYFFGIALETGRKDKFMLLLESEKFHTSERKNPLVSTSHDQCHGFSRNACGARGSMLIRQRI
jgi:hypothetical protein